MKQISDRIFYCGVLNPNMRVFDVIISTEFGTSYNSYVLRGSEKTAIIDGAHYRFRGLYREEIEAALNGTTPDYLIVNHTEPDHSGAIFELLAAYPQMKIVTNAVAAKNLKQIVNRDDLPLQLVKDGETLSLGDRTLQFLVAPFLHWPDTMMTYLPEEETLFSCDVFGCHFCEPGLLDSRIAYSTECSRALKEYFDCIFGPFKPFVVKGLQKLQGLPMAKICPSHGPIWTEGCQLKSVLEAYQQWSASGKPAAMQIPIFYCSAYGNTKRIGEAIRSGISDVLPEAVCELFDLIDENLDDITIKLNSSSAFLVGSPTINRDTVPPIWQLLSHFDAVNSPKRPCAIFGSYGWSGEAFVHIAQRLAQLKCKIFEEPFKINFVPSEDDLAAARGYGQRFAETLKS